MPDVNMEVKMPLPYNALKDAQRIKAEAGQMGLEM